MSKTVHYDAELRGICSLCNGSEKVRAKIVGFLGPEHFACKEPAEMYRRIMGLISNDKAIPTVQVLRTDPTLSVESQNILTADPEYCLTEQDAEALVDQLEQFRQIRVVYDGAAELTRNVKDTTPESIQAATGIMERIISQTRSKFEDSNMVISGKGGTDKDLIDLILSDDKPDRVLTGFREFDKATNGFARKDLVLIAATSGGGKTVMAEQLAINMYHRTGQNRSIAIVSFEMDKEEIYARLTSNLTQYDFSKVYLRDLTPEKRAVCREKLEEFGRHGAEHGNRFLVWCPTADITPAQVGAFLKPGNYDVVFIDYVGLVAPEQKKDLWENLGDITRGFKSVARQNNCVVIVMAQLDEDTNKVKYSKAMKHHSSYVWKWNYGPEQAENKQVQVQQEKARHCRSFPFTLKANFETMSFYDIPPEFPRMRDVTSKEENETTQRSRQPLYDDKPLITKTIPKESPVEPSDPGDKVPPETAAESAARILKARRLQMRCSGASVQVSEGDE